MPGAAKSKTVCNIIKMIELIGEKILTTLVSFGKKYSGSVSAYIGKRTGDRGIARPPRKGMSRGIA